MPVVAARLPQAAVHALLHDRPAAVVGHEEAVHVEVEAILYRGAVNLGDEAACARQLLGIEADLQGADVSAGFAGRLLTDGDLLNAHQNFDYFGTVRGRAGFAFYRGLIYLTGGFAYGGVRDQLFVFNPASGFSANLHNDDTRTGYVIGGGVELALAPHWSVKVEYQHIDLGSERLAASVLPPSSITITSNKLMDIVGTARIGLNYRFDTDHYYVSSK